eukprot:312447-Pyramimonas_sp.AAC.1
MRRRALRAQSRGCPSLPMPSLLRRFRTLTPAPPSPLVKCAGAQGRLVQGVARLGPVLEPGHRSAGGLGSALQPARIGLVTVTAVDYGWARFKTIACKTYHMIYEESPSQRAQFPSVADCMRHL